MSENASVVGCYIDESEEEKFHSFPYATSQYHAIFSIDAIF